MKTRIRLTFALTLLCAAMSTAAFASSVYFVQGIPGRNVAAATDPAFPVDVLINDEACNQHGLPFGVVPNPLTFFPGTYNVKVSVANTLAPCTNAPLVERNVTIEARTDMSLVTALNESGIPTLLTFTNDLTPVAANSARVLFAYAAAGPAVQVVLQNTSTQKVSTYTVNPGAQLEAELPAGNYTVAVNEGTTTLVPAANITLSSQSVNLLYGIGQATNNTFVLETRTLRDVI